MGQFFAPRRDIYNTLSEMDNGPFAVSFDMQLEDTWSDKAGVTEEENAKEIAKSDDHTRIITRMIELMFSEIE